MDQTKITREFEKNFETSKQKVLSHIKIYAVNKNCYGEFYDYDICIKSKNFKDSKLTT